ncbi:hypothetical protein [Zavarzinia sp. CC-PAN008]|uniref:hypothetical protein n=1 Tax=Zavarzinia sp. CC-PAN008 TaxID=3243332 RepID=UPI003F744CB9
MPSPPRQHRTDPPIPLPAQAIPTRLFHEGGRILADWADIGGTDPTLPFLTDRIAAARPLGPAPLPPAGDVTQPAALILHAGRCGSTLVSRALSRVRRCHVLSEPQALNDVLGVDGLWPFLPRDEKGSALRQVVAALARAATPGQDRVILKLSSWNALHLPLLEEVFPTVPKLFAYRAPHEILVSLRDRPAGWMQRAGHRIQARLFLGAAPAPARNAQLGFAAQVLGRSLAAVADSVARPGQAGTWLLVPYEALPGALAARILPWLGLAPTPMEAAAIAHGLELQAKDATGRQPFAPDGARKRASVTPDLADLVRDLVSEPHERLERLRQAGDTACGGLGLSPG